MRPTAGLPALMKCFLSLIACNRHHCISVEIFHGVLLPTGQVGNKVPQCVVSCKDRETGRVALNLQVSTAVNEAESFHSVPIKSLFLLSMARLRRAMATALTTLSTSERSSSTKTGSPFSFLTVARM
ncbi:hypothetical protein XENOCAPTIV_027095 [Xenoophorus captivus]|uniref:Secreted protein n=1 Tax=Xenoophorus captivus TaxID=1517983 RepID=A0ABV0QER2_9TELE